MALGECLRHVPGTARPGSLIADNPDDFGDDVTRPLDDHVVARSHVLASHLVLVVKGGAADCSPTHYHGLEPGHRRDRTRPADVDPDLAHDRLPLLGRKLEGEGPAGTESHEAEHGMLTQVVHLDDHAVAH